MLFDLSPLALWGQVRDWRRFLLLDPLHQTLDDVKPARDSRTPAGTTFLIRHRFCGIGPTRSGRILRWREGSEIAISDLSRRGPALGFPHICTYQVRPEGNRARLILGVRGLWTARWVPRPLINLWLRWVLLATEAHIRHEILAFERWRGSIARNRARIMKNTRASLPARVQ